jgi:hypothetical protein
MMDVLESFLHRSFVIGDGIQRLKASVPPKPPRTKNRRRTPSASQGHKSADWLIFSAAARTSRPCIALDFFRAREDFDLAEDDGPTLVLTGFIEKRHGRKAVEESSGLSRAAG